MNSECDTFFTKIKYQIVILQKPNNKLYINSDTILIIYIKNN